jgi:hypothetical protein
MQRFFDENGVRTHYGQPYINEEETMAITSLYSPNGPGPHYGLYDRGSTACGRWVDHFHSYMRKHPHVVAAETVDRDGRVQYINGPRPRQVVKFRNWS